MGLWRVGDATHIELANWTLVMTERGEVHLAGYDVGEEEGRVSSALAGFDSTTRKAKTLRGRDYTLVGEPGLNGDAMFVLEGWLKLNRVPWTLNVTEDILANGFDNVVALAKASLES